MRVLWVFDHLSPQLKRVATLLADRPGLTLEVMCRWDGPPPLDPSRIPLTQLRCRHKLDLAARRAIRSQIARRGYDLVQTYTSRNLANVIGACRGLRDAPRIVGYRGAISRLRLFDPANWITFWHPSVSKIVCASRAVRQALLDSGIPNDKLAPVVEGCDGDSLRMRNRESLTEFGVVGGIANMRPVKGMDLLLKAAVQLADLTNVYFLLIGEVMDSQVTELARDPRISNRVRLGGRIPDAGRFANLFDVYAAPSRMEGLGMSVIEAMSQRVCPIVSNVGGLPELVEHETNGLIVPKEDAPALADAVRRLHDDSPLRRCLADAAYQRANDEFSIEAWTRRLYAVYAELTGGTMDPQGSLHEPVTWQRGVKLAA